METDKPTKSPKQEFSPETQKVIERLVKIFNAPPKEVPIRKVTDHYYVIG